MKFMACGLDGKTGALAHYRVAREPRLDRVLVTILPQQTGVWNATRMDLWGKKVDLVTKRIVRQKIQVMVGAII